ncbi:alanine aminotransferase, mitochondrial, putative [Acanthamoeba castellanii str. Neff]|uniref:Alanine aminotransferase, mitochondrial, putative n=1 Tax=Acanthamoeba castellanii (strain ATCC 30010 / Neff) TaxID=1257118 RepID=L8HHW2_ACACF|nr:alanine aminotransferase, mitochondrial, putative [Acanthamoeba castellanii str. Neff]ELR24802.1 alanine aminotransferase, mitochondrial, putative [Acanthamoeba castellanii str. Neff]
MEAQALMQKILRVENMNQVILNKVQGELVIRAEELEQTLRDPARRDSLPFKEVLSLLEYPALLESADAERLFPKDAIARAKSILHDIPGGLGAYSNSRGERTVREHVAEFISERDGFACDMEDVFLTDGASAGVVKILQCLIRDEKDGILIPIPQYPLYSATIPMLGGTQLKYYLDEEKGWSLNIAELESIVEQALAKGVTPRAMVVINPGNPTGQCLDTANMQQVIEFCHRRRVLLMADEVYQANSYIRPFTSFKKVLRSMGEAYAGFELVSFHSVSKGVIGECGHRGGYMELVGLDIAVKQQIYKLASISLCPNIAGQVVVDLMVRPPKPGDDSHDQFQRETQATFESLKKRAGLLATALNQLEGVTCNPAEGAMYLFPRIRLPQRAIDEAKRLCRAPDVFYCFALLDATGFGQRDGTFHFRTTFLPQEEQIRSVVAAMAAFHARFMDQWRE